MISSSAQKKTKKNWGGFSASTWKALQWAYHHSERSTIGTTCSPTLEAHCQELCTLMIKWMPGLWKPVQHLADNVEVFGIKVESDLTQSWKSTDLWYCQHYYMHVSLRQFTKNMPKDWTTSIQAVLDSRNKGPKKSRYADCTYSSKTGIIKMDRPCYRNTWWTFAKENPLWRTTSGKMVPIKPYKDTNKPPLRISTYRQSRGNSSYRIQQNGEASIEGLLVNTMQKE